MPSRSSKRPRDINQLAKHIIDTATGNVAGEMKLADVRNPAAVALGRLGGQKGGAARAKKLTSEQRRDIARIAAAAMCKKPIEQ